MQNKKKVESAGKITEMRLSLVASSVLSSLMLAAPLQAQEQENITELEEIVVSGYRYSQQTAVNRKRDSEIVMDSLVADDIGKLPDVTIADSLQRIAGVQITRSAGEGSSVNIRGLPQVVSQLNGEAFLSAGSINSVQPSYNDLPAPLFAGADVYKTTAANLATAGITGTINLRTRRPFDFEEGIESAISLDLQQGQETDSNDGSYSGLINWRNKDMGVMVSAAYSNPSLANYYSGFNTGSPTGAADWVNGVNDWGGSRDLNTIAPQGVVAWNQVTQRERIGLNAAFQWNLSDSLEFIAEGFFTEQDEFNRKVGFSATNKWQGLDYFTPTQFRRTGDVGGAGGREWASVQEMLIDARRVKSFTQNDSFLKDSVNVNMELRYDAGDRFTASARLISANAEQRRRHGYNEGDLTDGTATGLNEFYPAEFCAGAQAVGSEGGCFLPTNPLGYTEIPQITYNTVGGNVAFSGFDNPLAGGLGAGATLRDYMANLGSYNIGAFSSENNADSEADMNIARVDGSYNFDEGAFITSIDAGLRYEKREVAETRFHLFSPFYDEGCLAQWKATDVRLGTGDCQVGELVDGEFRAYTVLPPTPLDRFNNVSFITDFGPVSGIPGVWAVDPSDYDDPEEFHNRVFGSTTRANIPGTSYEVDLDTTTFYVQGNFATERLSGNLGLRVIDTDLRVRQNIAGAGIPYGNTNVDDGDVITRVSTTEVLPAINLKYQVNDRLAVRAAYTENTVPLDLNQWGDGLSISTSLDQNLGFFVVNSASEGGNPALDPWRSQNLDLSLEYYAGDASMFSVALFSIDIDSFIQGGTVQREFADPDGVVRRSTNVNTLVQGDGGTIEGAELTARMSFSDFNDNGFLKNFGLDMNYTYSPSEQDQESISGRALPFPQNSKQQYNVVGWYEQGRWQARIAYNFRSERLAELGRTSGNLNVWQEDVDFVDISASYAVNDSWTVFFQGSNVTESNQDFYLEWEDQFAYRNFYEARYTLGLRGKF